MNPRTNRFVFVAGLHRTGTTLLARIMGAHSQVSSIEAAPVPENEGCYLQGAIPHTALHGRPGHYAINPEEHHTESSRYNTLETKMRLLADWSPWFAADRHWWIEKSPVNLTRMRLYQQLFPTAQFVVILRHPQIMAAALAKWVDTDPRKLVRYALKAYELMASDLAFLHSALVLRYEDLVVETDATRRSAFAFLSLPDEAAEFAMDNGNRKYSVPEVLDADSVLGMERWGYRPGGRYGSFTPVCQHPLREVREAVEAASNQPSSIKIEAEERKEQKANIRQ